MVCTLADTFRASARGAAAAHGAECTEEGTSEVLRYRRCGRPEAHDAGRSHNTNAEGARPMKAKLSVDCSVTLWATNKRHA